MEITLASVIAQGIKLTPMMEQYSQVKILYPGVIVLFRMGDFYEMFFEDARESARLLNISLTHRGKLGDHPIPMAGIPHHAASTYIDRLTQMGLKVVICEQIEDPKEAIGIVKRAVTQIVSPALPFDLDKIQQTDSRFIAVAFKTQTYFLVLLDYTTGDFIGMELKDEQEFIEKLYLYHPQEFISSLGQWDHEPVVKQTLQNINLLETHLSTDYFNPEYQTHLLSEFIPHFEKDKILSLTPTFLNPLSALAYYVSSTQKRDFFSHLRPFKIINYDELMKVSFPTLRGLEILPRDKENYKDSLIGFMDKTQSAMGSRALKHLFLTPSRSAKEIERRLSIIESLLEHSDLLEFVRQEMKQTWDMDRIICKISNGKTSPSDLLNLSKTIQTFFKIEHSLNEKIENLFPLLNNKVKEELLTLAQTILLTINQEPGASTDKGNLINPGVHQERDELAHFHQHSANELIRLENKYRTETGIHNLKIKSNNISGYFIEVSLSHLKKVPETFKRRQTLVNNERFITDELEKFEQKVLRAEERLRKVEMSLFLDFIQKCQNFSTLILDVAKRLSLIDVYASLSWVAKSENFSRPKIVTEQKIQVTGAWHPLIRAQIKNRFVTHNLELNDKNSFALITGPNMAGKTTVMREMAIIQFLTQIGSFVPATSAVVSPKDYIFSRLGASDDIIRGQSTFMVEMSETSEILRHASINSLIVLDEIGRGTSTYDGLAIAWSLVEHFVLNLKSLTLFATHYHELIDLVESLPHAHNYTVRTEQKNGKVHFLYDLVPHGATQSFGIHVAEMAGLPKSIIERSKSLLKDFEKSHHQNQNDQQLSLFEIRDTGSKSQLEEHLKNLDLNHLTPLQALLKLSELKDQLH